MSVYSYNTQGIFPSIIRAASEGLGSFSYVYEPSIIDRYNELDYGSLAFNPTPVTATETVAVDNLNATLTNIFLTNSGTGTGATGGFNIGRHIRFNSSTTPRTVEFSLPNNINSSLTFEVIRGNDVNGGEDPDTTNESLYLEYYDGSSWTSIDTVVAYNDATFNTLKSVEIAIPSVARTAGTQFRLIQPFHSGNDWDHYGLKSLTYTYTTTPVLPTINFGSILDDNVTLEDYGRVIYVTNVESFGFFKYLNAASWKATSTYEGSGIAFSFSNRTNAAVYSELVDGKIKLTGSSHTVFSPTTIVGGNTSIGNSAQIGFSLKFSGSGSLFEISNTEESKTYDYVSASGNISITGIAQEEYARTYITSGTLFEFNNARILSTNSYAGSGTLKLRSNNKESIAESYNNFDIVVFRDFDYGFIGYCDTSEIVTGSLSGSSTACAVQIELGTTASINQEYKVSLGVNEPGILTDLGSITIAASPQHDYGHIHVSSDLTPFGLFDIDPSIGAADKFLPTWTSRGYISKLTGEASVPLDVSVYGTGSIRTLGGDAVTNFSLLQPGNGLFDFVGSVDVIITQGFHGSGTIPTLSGVAESITFNKEEKQILFSPIGEATIAFTPNWIGSGNLFTFNSVVEKVVYEWVGSGSLFGFNNTEESRVYVYNCETIVEFETPDYGFIERCTSSEIVSGDISGDTSACTNKIEEGTTARVVSGQTYKIALDSDIANEFIDYGYVRDAANAVINYGNILDTPRQGLPGCIYGEIEISGESQNSFTPNFNGFGYISKLSGVARVPLDVSVFGEGVIGPVVGFTIPNFSILHPAEGELGRFFGKGNIGIVVGITGEGSLPTLGGASESVSFNPEEKQMLFSFIGEGIENSTTSHTGEGVLFALQTAVEKVVYEWVGSGTLFGFDSKEEARVYSYNCSSIVEFESPDYGFVERSLLTETVSGDISGTTDASTVRVEENGSARIISGQSYRPALNSDIASQFADYEYITDAANALVDYGHILDTPRQGLPGCTYGEIAISGSASYKLQPTYIAEGFISKLTGVATVPLDVAVPVYGTIGTFKGDSVPNFSLLHPGSGQLARIHGTLTNFNFTLGFPGSGTIPSLGGAAETATFNPDEKQMLFSFIGKSEDSLAKAWAGDGNLFTLQTAVERRVYDYVGSGTLFGFDSKEEARVYSYNCSSIVEFETPDYGLVQSCSVLESINGIVSGQAVGCTARVDLGSTASINGSYQVDLFDGIASEFAEYGLISDRENAVLDYGHIFDTPREGLPGCIYGTIELRGAAKDTFDPANVGQGTIFVDGNVSINFTQSQIGSGFFSTFSGAAESIAIAEESTDLFDINGSGHVVITLGYHGDGDLSTIGGAAEVATFNPPEDVPTIKLRGTSGDPGIRLSHTGEGNLFSFSGGDIRVQYSYQGSGILFGFNSKEEARTYVYDGGICKDIQDYNYGFLQGECLTIETIQGSVTGTTNSCIVKVEPGTTASVNSTYRIDINDGTATELYDYDLTSEPPDGLHDYGHILGETGVLCPAYLFKIRRGALSDFETFDWQQSFVGSGTLLVSGVGRYKKVPRYNGSGQIFAINGAAESLTVNPVEKQLLFSFTGTLAESFTPATEIGSGDLFTLSTLDERVSNDYVGAGTFIVSGESVNSYTPNHNGSGSFRKLSGAAESLTVNPTERQMLFSFTGELQEAFAKAPYIGQTEIKISGEIPTPLLTFVEQPEVQISVFDTARQRYTPSVVGSGSFKTLSGSAESLTVNPDEKQLLFSFTSGITSEKHTEVYVGIDTPIRVRRGALSDFETFDWQPSWVSSGGPVVTGTVRDKFVPNNVGFGNIFAINGAAESLTVNPDERQMLFSFTGTRANESTRIISQTEGGTITLSGASGDPILTFAEQPEVQIAVSDVAGIKASLLHIGSGSFRKLSGAAESFTANPDEKQMLFSFTGTLLESFSIAETKQIEVDVAGIGSFTKSFVYRGFGTLTVTGEVSDRFVVNNIGFGNIFNLGGSAEAVTFNPDEKQMLFSFIGTRDSEKRTSSEVSEGGTIVLSGTSGDPVLTFAEQPEVQIAVSGVAGIKAALRHIGSGSLFAFSGGAESITFTPPTDQPLFDIVGNSINKFVANYVGTGSFRKLSGAAESVSFNPDEKQMLFSFIGTRKSEKIAAREISQGGTIKLSGDSSVRVSIAHEGKGSILVTGNAHIVRARDFIGTGFIPVLSGSAEAITFNPDEKQMLFSFVGERIAEKITARELGTPGEFTLQGTSGDPLLTFSEQPLGEIYVDGVGAILRTHAFAGSGVLFGFDNGDEAYARAPYQASGNVKITGAGFVQVQLFQPPRVYVWVI